MSNPSPSLSLKFAFLLSLSLYTTTTSSSSSSRLSFKSHSSPSPSLSKPKPKASAADLLSLLGTKQQASSVNPKVAEELKSCFKFIVPFSPHTQPLCASRSNTRSLRRVLNSRPECKPGRREEEEVDNNLVWFPPAPVMELARIAVDSGGDAGAIHRALDPTIIPVPDIEGSKEDHCELTRTPYGRRFINEELNSYLEFLFKIIAARCPNIGLNISLNRYDFFHGHIFLATDSGRLGTKFDRFHAKEYPAYDKEVFPYNMGYCQIGSNVTYDDSMNLRNILWLAPLPSNSTKDWLAPGVVVVLDARPGGIIFRDLIPDYVQVARTLYEGGPGFEFTPFTLDCHHYQRVDNIIYEGQTYDLLVMRIRSTPSGYKAVCDTLHLNGTRHNWVATARTLYVEGASPATAPTARTLATTMAHDDVAGDNWRSRPADDFGDIVGDVNYLDVGGAAPNHQIFIC
ncbi:hypothetical protein LguiB_021313 [Lonicera macranthoides]